MIWLNGETRAAKAAFSANDRGLLLGEAVFETLLVTHGRVSDWHAHLNRLWAACVYADLACPYTPDELADAARTLHARHSRGALAVLRLTVTGGDGGRGLVPETRTPPNWLMQITPARRAPTSLRLVLLKTQQYQIRSAPTGYKTTAYLENIRARRAAMAAGADEALLCSTDGFLSCAAAGNVFVFTGDALLTPRLRDAALPGITRAKLLELGSFEGYPIREARINRAALGAAQAVFICNSVIGVVEGSLVDSDNTQAQAMPEMASRLWAALPQTDFLKMLT